MRTYFQRISLALMAVLLLGGCSSFGFLTDFIKPKPQPLLPAADLYQLGETELNRRRYEDARHNFRKIVERHPTSNYAPRARFLIGEAYYRDGDFDKAIKEFEAFLAFFPRHEIADLVQYRLAMSWYDQMKPVEQDQGITVRAIESFTKLVRDYPDSRYASDALAKIDVCKGRLAQKELWVATYYFNQGTPTAARQRLEQLLKDYPRSLVIPEALYRLGEVYTVEGRPREAQDAFRRLSDEYPFTEWGRRAAQRLRTASR
jgi:outer membrane protein assembly factor BamD